MPTNTALERPIAGIYTPLDCTALEACTGCGSIRGFYLIRSTDPTHRYAAVVCGTCRTHGPRVSLDAHSSVRDAAVLGWNGRAQDRLILKHLREKQRGSFDYFRRFGQDPVEEEIDDKALAIAWALVEDDEADELRNVGLGQIQDLATSWLLGELE